MAKINVAIDAAQESHDKEVKSLETRYNLDIAALGKKLTADIDLSADRLVNSIIGKIL